MSDPLASAPEPGGSRSRRQRRILIRPADQFRTSLVPTLGAAVFLVLLLAAVHQVDAARVRELSEANPAFSDVLEAHAAGMEATLATLAIVYLFGVLAVGLIHSRRLMGALFAMHRRLRRMAAGDLATDLRLRRGDYFHDVADAINEAAGVFRRQTQEDLADVDDLISVLDRSPHAGPLRDGLRETLAGIRSRKRRLLSLGDPEPERRERPIEVVAR